MLRRKTWANIVERLLETFSIILSHLSCFLRHTTYAVWMTLWRRRLRTTHSVTSTWWTSKSSWAGEIQLGAHILFVMKFHITLLLSLQKTVKCHLEDTELNFFSNIQFLLISKVIVIYSHFSPCSVLSPLTIRNMQTIILSYFHKPFFSIFCEIKIKASVEKCCVKFPPFSRKRKITNTEKMTKDKVTKKSDIFTNWLHQPKNT